MKKGFSILLAMLMVLSSFICLGTAANAADYKTGDVIEFGSYPQSEVKDNSLISALNSKDGTWVSYNYYIGAGTPFDGRITYSNYMRYKEVTYNGTKYRAVTFDSYRPFWTGYFSSTDYTYQDENGYTTGNVYWFKYEPLKWRVLDKNTGLVMCATIIDSQPYNNYIISNGTDSHGNTAYWGDNAKTYYANNYANSSIRDWLNNDFYNTAFSDEQKTNIKTTTLNNSCYYTLTGNSGYEEYDAPITNDKVFLLSYDEVLNSTYGFSSSASNYDISKRLQGSDYAECQGLNLNISNIREYAGNSCWGLRSPGIGTYDTCLVSHGGSVEIDRYFGHFVTDTDIGVVPAVCLKNLSNDQPLSFPQRIIQWFKNIFSSIANIFKK